MPFQIHALPMSPFKHLFDLSLEELTAQNAIRVTASSNHGYPCRVSLKDAKKGQDLILFNYQHLKGDTPYEASHAIYVSENATEAKLEANEIPEVLSLRILSLRGFDESGLMREADVVEGTDLGPKLLKMFENPQIAFIDIHNAKQGCFAAKATRA